MISGFRVCTNPPYKPDPAWPVTLLSQVPPLVKEWTMGPSVCPKQCTQKFTKNLTIVRALLHMHGVRQPETLSPEP